MVIKNSGIERIPFLKIKQIGSWLSGWKNLPEILLGYHQDYDGDNEYSYRDLLW